MLTARGPASSGIFRVSLGWSVSRIDGRLDVEESECFIQAKMSAGRRGRRDLSRHDNSFLSQWNKIGEESGERERERSSRISVGSPPGSSGIIVVPGSSVIFEMYRCSFCRGSYHRLPLEFLFNFWNGFLSNLFLISVLSLLTLFLVSRDRFSRSREMDGVT